MSKTRENRSKEKKIQTVSTRFDRVTEKGEKNTKALCFRGPCVLEAALLSAGEQEVEKK